MLNKMNYIQRKFLKRFSTTSGLKSFKPFKGLMVATFTPLSNDGMTVNLNLIESYAKDLVKQGNNGIYLCGTTGEFCSLTVNERKDALEAWMQTNEVKQGQLKVLPHVGSHSIKDTIELAQHASKFNNIQGVAVVAPSYFKPKTEDDMLDFLEPVSKAVPNVPLYFYHFPGITNVNLRVSKMLNFGKNQRKLNNLLGCKYTHLDFQDYGDCCRQGFNMLIGADDYFYSSLVVGGDAGIGITFNYAGELHRKIFDLFNQNKHQESMKEQAKSRELFAQILSCGDLFSVSKYLYKALRNVDLGGLRTPLKNLDDNGRKKVDANLKMFQQLVSIN